jgi:hypothetical protein
MKTTRMTKALTISATIGLVAIVSFCAETKAQVEFLEQNWSPEVRQAFYTTSQGSRMMPYSWFMALEASDSQESFSRVKLIQLGYLDNENTTDNPDRLPVGFVKDQYELNPKEDFIGLTCAACHTTRLSYGNKTYQIDGAPTLADMWGMLTGIDDSLKATMENGDKFSRFAGKVLGVESSNPKAVAELRSQVVEFRKYWTQFIQDSRTTHPWGRGRLDAFGMIFNRVSSIDLGIPENSRAPDAPVSYPFLWGASFQSRVQWNGVAENTNDIERLGRNVGEVLGVFAQAQFKAPSLFELPQLARTSAKRLNLVKLENQLKTLWSPKWPSHLGQIDQAKRKAGKVLYSKHCASCHQVVDHGKQDTPVQVVMTPLSEVGTDPKMAVNSVSEKVLTGNLKKLFQGRASVSRGELLQTLVQLSVLSPYRDVTKGGIIDRLRSDDLFSAEEVKAFLDETGVVESVAMKFIEEQQEKLEIYYQELKQALQEMAGRPEPITVAANAPPTLEYKAAPLVGIWATAPYLHNGSVPNLYELLLPVKERSPQFYVGNHEFDPAKVGYVTSKTEGTTLFDTSLPGNSNEGHDTYGEFNEEQRWQLVEYLKSL